MTHDEALELFERNGRRWHLVGTRERGVLIGLDLEGRLFPVLDGQIGSRINPDAFPRRQTGGYGHPGGDGLWPAPEGTTLGYQYSTGAWRVPPGLVGAQYFITAESGGTATARAEIDLVNNRGLGIPTAFQRAVAVVPRADGMQVCVEESIQYLGSKPLDRDVCILTPWSLCPFEARAGCEVVFPAVEARHIRDLYDPSDNERAVRNDHWHVRTEGTLRFQIAMDAEIPWIEFRDPARGLRVRRSIDPLPADQAHIDIADAPPTEPPDPHGVRFSVYNDAGGFMEIEAAGGCPARLEPGSHMRVHVVTDYSMPAAD